MQDVPIVPNTTTGAPHTDDSANAYVHRLLTLGMYAMYDIDKYRRSWHGAGEDRYR